jgi:NDP-sugar pyrophosphorylase family protein
MDAIILAGGKGTRLASVVPDAPKPLALVGGRPFLSHIVDLLIASGKIKRIFVSAGYKAELMQDWARSEGGQVSVIVEAEPLGTGGAVLHILEHAMTTEPFVVLNGDSLVRMDLAAMVDAHHQSGCGVTLAVTHVKDVSQSGEVRMSGDRITAFHEKGGVTRPGWINAGIYVMNKNALKPFPQGVASLEHDILPKLIGTGLNAFHTVGAFVDIGTPESYAAAADILGVV